MCRAQTRTRTTLGQSALYVFTVTVVSLFLYVPPRSWIARQTWLGGNQSGLDGNKPRGLTELPDGAFLRALERKTKFICQLGR